MKTIPLRFINTSPKQLNEFENFSIRNLSEFMGGSDIVQDTHRHDYFFILALTKGKGDHTIDFITYMIKNNTIFFMRPGQVHRLRLKAGSEGYLIQFKRDFYLTNEKDSRLLLRKVSSKNILQPDHNTFKKLFAILKEISKESKNRNERYSDVIKANLSIFFIGLVRFIQKNQLDSDEISAFQQDRLEEFSELLNAHISKNKQPAEYAKMLNLTPYQLNKITKTASGKTSSEFINEQIILESKRYLLSTSNQIKEIAYHLGYEDTSYFIRFFKKRTGLSPEAFRSNFS
ncbi:MAG TPA: AraC family transcriptional regulator [Ignavibacteriales bacterium]|nr:AraC family transcriptional regulator [Ignavibacteriales bacterium]